MSAAAVAAALSRATGLGWLLNYCGFWFDHLRLVMLLVKVTQIRHFGFFDFLHELIKFREGGHDLIILEIVHSGLVVYTIFILFQALLRDASNVLYTALDQRAFFKSVTIVVPSSWRDSKCQTIIRPPRGGTPYRNADIHISKR